LSLLKNMKEKGGNKLILDLRGNNGGFLVGMTVIMSRLVDKPNYNCIDSTLMNPASFKLVKHSSSGRKLIKSVRKKKRRKNIFSRAFDLNGVLYSSSKGLKLDPKNIVVLVDERTYSAAAICASTLQEFGSTVIGAPSMSDNNIYYAFEDEKFITPNYRVSFLLPLVQGIRKTKLLDKGLTNLTPNYSLAKDNADALYEAIKILSPE